jgi:hypothetical protein
VEDLGAPIGYLTLRDGSAVYDRDGVHVGEVEHVLADEGVDIFHGLIVRTPPPSSRHLFATRDQIGGLYERAVVLSVPAQELHVPSADRPARDAAGDTAHNPVQEGLRRAWDWLSRPQ